MRRPTFAQIDLNALVHNLAALRSLCGPSVETMGIIKANAYGHGAVEVSRALAAEGIGRFAVAILDEAVTLHDARIPGRILLLGSLFPDEADEIVARGFEATVTDMGFAERLSVAALKQESTVPIHIKFDTGMGRVGFPTSRTVELTQRVAGLRGLTIVGAMTHFPVADESDGLDFTRGQVRTFLRIRDDIRAAGIEIPLWHAANSAALLGLPESHLDVVRPGIAIYGGRPKHPQPCPVALRQVMTLKTRIAQIRDVSVGQTISYGRTFRAERPSRIAVLSVGYADGFDRHLSNKGTVIIRGKRAPIAGRVCMDMTMADVTDIPEARPGDEVVLWGSQGGEHIGIDEVADLIGSISNTVVTCVGPRVPRIYKPAQG